MRLGVNYDEVFLLIYYFRAAGDVMWRAVSLRTGESNNSSFPDPKKAVDELKKLPVGSQIEIEVVYE